jgi:diguanylate cyclase (GGDEF)-like protein
MRSAGKLLSALAAGWLCLAINLLPGAALAAAPDDPAQLLKYADGIKTSNHAEFTDILKRLSTNAATLSPEQALYLRYLNGWQYAYGGDYESSIPLLNAVIKESKEVRLQFRAGVTAVNVLAISSHYEEAFSRLSQLLDMLPQVTDKEAREQGLAVAALLYNQAGRYELALNYANQLLQENATPRAPCKGGHLKLEALYKSGKLQANDKQFQDGIDACSRLGEPIFANLIRTFVANLDIDNDNQADAIQLLTSNYADVQATRYPELMAEFDSLLARAYWKSGDVANARQFAHSAIDKAIQKEITKPLVDADQVLYQIAEKEGDFPSALVFHEKYAAADKGYLNDVSARTLAYEMVTQQVVANKLQIDALNKQNEVLQLQQALDQKAAETGRLYVALLLSILGFIALWAYKTKRSQLRFMKLARRDGLTGIFNRQHFVDAALQSLEYCRKSARDACVVVIDLDHFKLINDAHGHAVGDMVLKRAVAVCESHLRSIDLFGRLGGEEFGILMPDCTLQAAQQCAERLRVAIVGLNDASTGIDFEVAASFGIAATAASGYELRQLLAHADAALYEAKRAGRNRVALFQAAA